MSDQDGVSEKSSGPIFSTDTTETAACSDWPSACQHSPAHDNGRLTPELRSTTENVRLTDEESDDLSTWDDGTYLCSNDLDFYCNGTCQTEHEGLNDVVERIIAARVAEAKIEVLRQMANEIRGSWTGAKCAEVLMEEAAVRERFDPNYRGGGGNDD